jgi:hypothetical protein
VLEALEGKRTIKETTSALVGCGKTILARKDFDGPHGGGRQTRSVWSIWLVSCNQTNQTDRTDQMNKTGWRTFSASSHRKFQLFVS